MDKVVSIKIADIRTNSINLCECIVSLGLSEKAEYIVSLGLSEKAEDRAKCVAIIKQFDVGIVQMAHNLRIGMLSPILVRANGDGYDLIYGGRRLLAALYESCDEPIFFPAEVEALVCVAEDERPQVMVIAENLYRLNMNSMEQARIFSRLKQLGLTIQQIANQTNIQQQLVRVRLKLLQLPPEIQSKVEDGGMSVCWALTLFKV